VVQQDTTTITIEVLGAPLNKFPTNIAAFQRMFLNPIPKHPIPVYEGIFSREALTILESFVVENPKDRRQHYRLGALIERAFLTVWRAGSEYSQVPFWDMLVREPLELLSDYSDNIKLVINRNVADPSGVIRKGTRPDFLCWLEGLLVLLGEEKYIADEFLAALSDLKTKSNQIL
jgi:hypothetical protein